MLWSLEKSLRIFVILFSWYFYAFYQKEGTRNVQSVSMGFIKVSEEMLEDVKADTLLGSVKSDFLQYQLKLWLFPFSKQKVNRK